MPQALDIGSYAKLTTRIFAAALDPREWSGVLDDLSALSGGVRTHCFAVDTDKRRSLGTLGCGYDPAFLHSYALHYHDMNPWLPGFMTSEAGQSMSSADMCPDEALLASAFYHEWLRPQDDIIGGGGAILVKTPDSAFILGGNIPRRHHYDLEGPWMEVVNLVKAPLQHGWELGRLAAVAMAEELIGQMAPAASGAVVIDGLGRAAWANRDGETLLATGDVIGLEPGHRVVLADPCADEAFRQLQAAHRLGVTVAWRHTVGLGTRRVEISVTGFAPDIIDLPVALAVHAGSPSLLLTVTPAPVRGDPADLLADRFGLTPAEADVALGLASGLPPSEIAERRGVSCHTVRNQSKAIYDKCGVSRQSQFVALVAGLDREATGQH